MRLPIEEWAKNNLDEDALPILDEAIICYKVGAFKSAYLMSYLSFKITIRERIIKSKYHPSDFSDSEWQVTIVQPLEDDNKWEELLNSIIDSNPNKNQANSKKFAAIFSFQDREYTLNKYIYFKNIRNSCAHAKQETINSSTVEQLWNYMIDNLSEYYVLGGKEYLNLEVYNSYKYRRTKEYFSNMNRILRDISIVYCENSYECFENAFRSVRIDVDREDLEYWGMIINYDIELIQNSFIIFVMKNIELFIDFYRYFPQILLKAYSLDEKFIQDSVNEYFIYYSGYQSEKQEIYWKLLYECLCKYSKHIDLNRIANSYQYGVSNVSFSEDQIEIFRERRVFNKLLSGKYELFFKVEYNDIRSNGNSNVEIEAKELFQYVEWNDDLVRKLSYSISRLEERKNTNYYGSWESRRSDMFRDVVVENKDDINEVLNKSNIIVCEKMRDYLS